MNKLLTIFISLFMIITLIGCESTQEEEPFIDEPIKEVEEVIDIETKEEIIEEIVEEPIEEIKEEKLEEVTELSFWVVFYDSNNNELQRTIEKDGTTPVFKSNLPQGFISWDTTLSPITTNTYIHAICKEPVKQEEEPTINYPNKGEQISMYVGKSARGTDSDGYMNFLVLDRNDSVVKVLGLNSIESHEYNYFYNYADFGGVTSFDYDGSEIDTILCNWYDTLDVDFKTAIKSTSLKQYLVECIGETYEEGAVMIGTIYYRFTKYITIASDKYVFAPDIDDISAYIEDDITNFDAIKEMMKIYSSKYYDIWGRTAGFDHYHSQSGLTDVIKFSKSSGLSINTLGGDPEAEVVPCMYVDLANENVEYTVISEE